MASPILSMPHDGIEDEGQGEHMAQPRRDEHNAGNPAADEAIDIVVYFAENAGLHLQVVDGQNATASELFEMVMEEQHFPDAARELFSLWLVSDLLELQLKPTHIPFKLVCYWEELLEKYTSATEYNRQRDEPVITFKRNVFCTRAAEEQSLSGPVEETSHMLRLLYNEAKRNILKGRYPIHQQECDKMAGLQAFITEREQTAQQDDMNNLEYFKKHQTDYLPVHFCKRKWFFKTSENPENRLLNWYRSQKDRHQSVKCVEDLYKEYLRICRALPYYGCAFFRGQVKHPGIHLLRVDDPVYVAINTDGVYVIDEDDFVLLIGLPFQFLCWERAHPPNEEDPQCLPCLLLQFPLNKVKGKENSKETQLFQIFSREAILMDKLIEACVELKRATPTTESDKDQHIIKGYGEIAEQFERLALITFDENHQRKDKGSMLRSGRRGQPSTSA